MERAKDIILKASGEVKTEGVNVEKKESRFSAEDINISNESLLGIVLYGVNNDNFIEYRISIGAGTSPVSYEILSTQTIPRPSLGIIEQLDLSDRNEGKYTIKIRNLLHDN